MYFRVESSGCCERKGMVQVLYCFFLEPDDYGYEAHHVTVPDFTQGEYKGEVDKDGNPVDMTDYQKWVASLPTIERDNPFHNHICCFPSEISDQEIADKGKALLANAYAFWSRDEFPRLKNAATKWPVVTQALVTACESRVAEIKSADLQGTTERAG